VQYTDVVRRLGTALKEPLPGRSAHARLMPRPRRPWPSGFHPASVRHAAGLLLTFPVAGRAHVLLTERAGTLGRHGGQISLPGGEVDPGESVERAALREAHEEVALAPDEVTILGALTPLDIPVSGFRLHPIVGAASRRPPLVPADGEVAAILDVAIDALTDPACLRSSVRHRDGRRLVVPAFHVEGHEIWGATGMVLAEFLTLLGWDPQLS
jgi:8-oxo-dGTP pyrophosphatase MutT (NUDIX family)